jgi:hypothetical protein
VRPRRQVRVTQSFFDRLDELLPDERGADATPSTADFLLHEIPAIIDRLAEDFEGSTLNVAAVPDVRVLIVAGVLIPYVAVYAVLAPDDAVEIIYLDVDQPTS